MHLASVDGAIAPAQESRIAVTDDGLLRGDGVFEVLRLYAGRPFALDEHLHRLQRSAHGIRLEVDRAALAREIDALLGEADPGDALLRLVATRGGRRIAILEPLPERPEAIAVKTVTYTPTRLLDGLKTISYAPNMLAKRLAEEDGYDEALLVSPHGRVLEGPTWTFFYVYGGELCTPPLEDRILASITRDRVIETCGANERVTAVDDLSEIDEAFLASTVREVLPITRLDARELPSGPRTAAALEALRERIRSEL